MLLLLACPAWSADLARVGPGGTANDGIYSASTTDLGSAFSLCGWYNASASGTTGGRLWEWGDGSKLYANAVVAPASSHNALRAFGWSTTTGIWTIALPSLGADHSICWTYSASSTANNAVAYVDGSSVTVTRLQAPAGTWSSASKNITISNSFTGARSLNGTTAGFASWNAILSSGDVTKFHAKQSPCTIQPANLLSYFPAHTGETPEPDYGIGGTTGTVTGSTTTSGFNVKNPACLSRTLTGAGR